VIELYKQALTFDLII